jgi:hypothetical protein
MNYDLRYLGLETRVLETTKTMATRPGSPQGLSPDEEIVGNRMDDVDRGDHTEIQVLGSTGTPVQAGRMKTGQHGARAQGLDAIERHTDEDGDGCTHGEGDGVPAYPGLRDVRFMDQTLRTIWTVCVLLLLFALPAKATTPPGVTLSFTLQDRTGAGVPARVVLTLVGYGANVPLVAGTGVSANRTYTATANAGGVGSVTFYGNYQISPAHTYYQIQIFGSNSISTAQVYQFNTAGSYDLSAISPMTVLPAATGPVPTSILTGNNSWTGTKSFSTLSVSGAFTLAGFTATAGQNAVNAYVLNNIRFVDGNKYAQTDVGINSAITDLLATSPNGGILYLTPGTYSINNTLSVTSPVQIIGMGANGPTITGGPSPTPAVTLNCLASRVDCVHYSAVSGAENAKLKGAALKNVAIQGNGNATICLEISSVSYSVFDQIFINNCTTSGMKLGVVAALADSRDPQFNQISNISIIQGALSASAGADGIELTGDSSADASNNYYQNVFVYHKNGIGINISNADNETFTHTVFELAGGGRGNDILLGGSGSVNTAAREISFFGVDPSAGGLLQNGTANGNVVFKYSLCNGASVPTVSAGTLIQSIVNCGAASGNLISVPELVVGGTYGTQFFEGTGPGAGTAQYDICYGDSTAHGLKCSNNAGSFESVIGPPSGGTVFHSLGTPPNGTVRFCPDCTIANPCAGSGTGAIAKRLNGVWVCN